MVLIQQLSTSFPLARLTPFSGCCCGASVEDEKSYLFTNKGNYYRFGTYEGVNRVDMDHYPRDTNTEWKTGGKAVKGCLPWSNGIVYILLDGGYFTFMNKKTGEMCGHVFEIMTCIGLVLHPYKNEIKTAINWDNGKAYIFLTGGRYLRFDVATNRVDGGPSPIKGNWGQLLGDVDTKISGAMNWGNGKAYFFTDGGWYYQYDIRSDKVEPAIAGKRCELARSG